MKNNQLIYSAIMYLIIFILIFPLFVLLIWSITNNWPWPYIFPNNFGLRGFRYIFNLSNNVIKTLFFSIWLSFIVTLITLLISIPAAKALGVYNFKGKELIKLLVLAPIIVPSLTVVMGIHVAFIKIGLANTFWGVVLVHLIPCLPYGIRILTDVFEIIGESMEMQARVLGAKPIQIFFRITLPLISPGLISAGSLIFIVSFSQYFLTFLIGGGKIVTFSMLLFPFIQSGDRMMASALSIVFIVSVLIVLLIVEKAVKMYYKTEKHFYI